MVRVLEHTAAQHCPGWALSVTQLQATKRRLSESENHAANSQKLEHWFAAIDGAQEGDEVLLIDADTFIRRPLEPVWDLPFDVAYTVRPAGYPNPLNGGVVFLRVSAKTRHFMYWWQATNTLMRSDREVADRYKRYVGMNQRALASVLEDLELAADDDRKPAVLALPCLEWNCEDSTWASFHPEITRIVHVKSQLQAAVFGRPNAPAKPHLKALARDWHALEREANAGK